MRTEMEYQNNNYVCRQKDARGKSVQIQTDPNRGTITSVTASLNHSVRYEYDAMKRTTAVETDGLRVQKDFTHKVNGQKVTDVTKYILHGKNVVHLERQRYVNESNGALTQTGNTEKMHFWYDAQNRPAMVQYESNKYVYIHNLQGDIVGIVDSNGTEVVKYMYDAWGKQLGNPSGTMATTLG